MSLLVFVALFAAPVAATLRGPSAGLITKQQLVPAATLASCTCTCCTAVKDSEKACTAPIASHYQFKEEECRDVFCADPADTKGAADKKWSAFCEASCFASKGVEDRGFDNPCRPKEVTDTGVINYYK